MKSKLYFGLLLLQFFSASENAIAQSPDSPPWAWVKSLSSTNGIYGHAIAIDPNGSGDVYIAGGFEGTTDFDPGPDIFNLYSGSATAVANFVSKYDGSGNFIWAKALPGVAGGGGSPYSIAIDPVSGAIYTAGRVVGTVDFDPGPNTFNLTAFGNNDIFISKLDTAGNFVWAKAIGGPADDFGISLTFDPGGDGSVYTTGQFRGTVDFDPGNGTYNLTSKGSNDIFISKLNGSGDFQWAKAIGWVGDDVGRAIAFDPGGMGKVYTAGQFYKKVDFDPGDSIYNLTAAVDYENFISALDGSGNFLWAKQMGRVNPTTLVDRFGSIALDPEGSGEIYLTDPFIDTLDFDSGSDSIELTSAGNADVFISKLSDAGEIKWAGAIGGPNQDDCIDIAVQPGGSGNVFTLGMFKETADFDPGPDSFKLTSEGDQDMFISKLDSTGHFQWVKAIKGVANAYGQGIVADNHFVYVTGAFFGTSISFDSITLTNVGSSNPDLFFAKLDISSFTHGQIYVKQNATGNNDGTSWYNAFTKLQPALDQADNGDQLWIAAGTYIPEGPSPDSSHFLSKNAISIYGGFEGTESDLSQRKWQTFRTVINGDILGDDQDSTNRLDNAHNILIINNGDGETTLDGLIFSGGRGALYILNTDVKIRNCTFWDNDGNNGSGLYARYSDSDSISNTLVIKNSTFEQNRGVAGAGIFLRSENGGRALHYEIDSCTFKNNYSSSAGTIFSIRDSISQRINIIKNSEFLNNIGNYGGGAIFSVSENLIIENCNFEGNYARLYPGCCYPSGGILTFIKPSSSANIAIRKTIFNNNDVSEFSNGVVFIDGGVNAELDNVLFHGNYGYSSILSYGNTHLSNITMVDNQGGLIGYGNSTEIQNSIFDNETANFRYSGSAEIISKGGNISSDSTMAPVLMGYNGYADLHQTNPLLDSDFVPLPGSPCIDAGNPEGAPSPYDLAGNPRIHGNGIDAGAFESPFMVAVKDAVWDSQVFSIYPNPVLDVLNFELESDWIGMIRLHVYNNQGQPVYKSEINKSDRVQTFRENLSLLPPGEYVVLAITGKTTYATKIIFLR